MQSSVAEYVDKWLDQHTAEIYAWREHFHAHPELSNREFATTAFICTVLKEHGLEPVLFPGTGLMVDIGPKEGGKLAFRADIDALPIVEQTGAPFASTVEGVMHACGHDIHITVALGLACALSEIEAELDRGIRIIFQPAEEVMDGGATAVIDAGALEGVDCIYAVHAEPKLPVGTIGLRAGAITSASDILTVEVSGPGGHSARPHLTGDVVFALGQIVTQLPVLLSRRVDPTTATVLVFGMINGGYAPNAIPESGRVSGTVRTADIAVWEELQPLIVELVEQIVAPTGCRAEISYTRGVPPVINDQMATRILNQAAHTLTDEDVVEAPQSSGGEDFSWFVSHIPGSMARLGCWDGQGTVGDLHQADMLACERAIPVGIKLFAAVVDAYPKLPPIPPMCS